jgi:hypothetical protein
VAISPTIAKQSAAAFWWYRSAIGGWAAVLGCNSSTVTIWSRDRAERDWEGIGNVPIQITSYQNGRLLFLKQKTGQILKAKNGPASGPTFVNSVQSQVKDFWLQVPDTNRRIASTQVLNFLN